MGSRTDQYIGLNARAIQWLADNNAKPVVNSLPREMEGAFCTIITLSSFVVGDRIVYECIQASPWSSGPMYFTALSWDDTMYLKDNAVEESLWIEDYEYSPFSFEKGRYYI